MDPALTFTVADLADDEAVQLPCACRVRTFAREELAALVGRNARLHLIGLRRELWCRDCGEVPFRGRLAQHNTMRRLAPIAGEHGDTVGHRRESVSTVI